MELDFERYFSLVKENGVLSEKIANMEKENISLHKEIAELKKALLFSNDEIYRKTLAYEKARVELRRLKKGFFNKPDKDILKELGL